jgi:hypothetical protein
MYIGSMVILNTPAVQRQLSVWVAEELTDLLGAKVEVRQISLGLLNRLIVDDLQLYDLKGEKMLKVTRLAAKFNVIPIFHGKISINNVRLFGTDIQLERDKPDAPINYQFLIDRFASKDSIPKQNHIDLRINSLILRGKLDYNVLSADSTPGRFNPSHIRLRNISIDLSLKALTNDSVNASIKRISAIEESSGLQLKKLSLHLLANRKRMSVDNFHIELPDTRLSMDTLHAVFLLPDTTRNTADNIRFSFRMLPSTIALHDLAPLVPALTPFKEKLSIETEVYGTPDSLSCPQLSISAGTHFRLHGNVLLRDLTRPTQTYLSGSLSSLYADSIGMDFFARNLNPNYNGAPPILNRLGVVNFSGDLKGYIDNMSAKGEVTCKQGSFRADMKLGKNPKTAAFTYDGTIATEAFQLGDLLNDKQLGKVSLNLSVKGINLKDKQPDIALKGAITALDYNQYTYTNITLDGTCKDGGWNGRMALDDENGKLQIDGMLNNTERVPVYNLFINVKDLRPHELKLTKQYEHNVISGRLLADFSGADIDQMEGGISIDSLHITAPHQEYLMKRFRVTAQRLEQGGQLNIASDFMQANIKGNYSFHTLAASFQNILNYYLPDVVPAKHKGTGTGNNRFSFDIRVENTDILPALFNIPLKVYLPSTLKGFVNEPERKLRVEGHFPRLTYKERFIEAGSLLLQTPKDEFTARLRLTDLRPNSSVNVSIETKAKDNRLETLLNWGNNTEHTYSGKLSATTIFEGKKTRIEVHPTNVILNDTLWQVHPSEIEVDSGRVAIRDFYFSHNDRHLRANGIVSDRSQDTVRLDLKDINIGYVFDIARLGVDFSGEATGPAYARSLLKDPVMHTDLHIRNLGLNGGLLGDAHIHGEWHNDVQGILLDADIREKEIAHSHVHGYIYPLKPKSGLDLHIQADSTNLKFIEHYLTEITPAFSGRATGNVRLYGKFNALTLGGSVYADASMKVGVLNTTYNVRDSIRITADGLTFVNNRVFDTQGNQGTFNGYVRYEHFKHIRYNLQFAANNLLLMNTRESADFPFYGTVYGTGNIALTGNEDDGLNVNIGITTNRNTSFTYIKDYVSTAVNSNFISFVDKTPQRISPDSLQILSEYERIQREKEQEEEEAGEEADIRMNLQVEVTPEAAMKIIMDPIAGDYISGRGSGSIRTQFYNKADDVKMFGSYQISQGTYKFSLQEVIRKDFTIQEGSTITFNGDPGNATLDILANYTVNSVSLNDLMPNASDFVQQTNIKVNCTMNLTGPLTAPNLKLGLDIPTERDEVQALIRNYIPTDEQMNMQILYLLGIGKFYTPENINTTQNSNMMASVLSSTISGQLNNALSQAFNLRNWNFGTNLSTGEGWTEMEVEGLLSANLLNNRLLINGNFGYRDNPMSNTNFVGDFQAEWLVTRSGDIRLKAYNETNDRYYTRTNLTTQGIGIVFKRDFAHWRDLFSRNRKRLKETQKIVDEKKE